MRGSWIHAITGFALVFACCTCPADLRAAMLRGTVRDSSGTPIAGAIVRLPMAGPLHGVGLLCPSCYADCAKSARTDAAGRFAIAGLDDSLRFRALVAATGHAPIFVEHVIPASGPVEARLARRDTSHVPDSLRVRGRVLDPDGRALEGATVVPLGWRRGGLSIYGPATGDAMAVTDAEGRFELCVEGTRYPSPGGITVPDSAVAWTLEIQARGCAKMAIADVGTGRIWRAVRMHRGSGLHGRVLLAGRPLAGVAVKASASQRVGHLRWSDDQSVATDERGSFFFSNLPAESNCEVYGLISSFAPYGGAPRAHVLTAPDDSVGRIGELAPSAPRRVSGRVELADGTAPPAGTAIQVSRVDVKDSALARTAADGSFAFSGMPPESLDVGVNLRGWRFAPGTPGRNRWVPNVARVADRGDLDLVLRMEPAAR